MIIIEPPGPREAVADLRTLAANHKLGGHWKPKLRFFEIAFENVHFLRFYILETILWLVGISGSSVIFKLPASPRILRSAACGLEPLSRTPGAYRAPSTEKHTECCKA